MESFAAFRFNNPIADDNRLPTVFRAGQNGERTQDQEGFLQGMQEAHDDEGGRVTYSMI